jgi:multiple sugar transport system permease protein
MMERDLYDQTVKWIPRNPTLDNYKLVWKYMKYPEAFKNSLVLALTVSLLQLVSCTVVGYGFARFPFKGSKLLFGLVVFILIVPPQMIMIPLYLNFRYFDLFGLLPNGGVNLLGTYWPFILTSVTATGLRNGIFIYILRQFFRAMPRDLEDAAYVDGAGPLRTFVQIMLPGAVPAMVIVFLFAFVWQWNDFFLTNIFLGGKTMLPLTLDGLLFSASGYMVGGNNMLTGQYASLVNNTGMLMFMAPLLILYAFMQRYFIESIQRTGLVG